jgi:hypothetical protein
VRLANLAEKYTRLKYKPTGLTGRPLSQTCLVLLLQALSQAGSFEATQEIVTGLRRSAEDLLSVSAGMFTFPEYNLSSKKLPLELEKKEATTDPSADRSLVDSPLMSSLQVLFRSSDIAHLHGHDPP